METKTIKVFENINKRVDVFLSENTDFSRSYIKKLAENDNLFINGKPCKCNKTVKINDEISFNIEETKTLDVKPVDIALDIVYQDEDIAVINKPQGLVVHSGNGTGDDTLVNALLFHLKNLSGINGVIRPGIVHRIDKNTSGLLVVAKNDKSHIALSKQLEDKTCHRIYYALLEGVVKPDSGRIETFIGRNPKERTKMTVVKTGRKAITDYKVIKRYEKYTLCEFSLKTGRTHQIRVHAKYIGHPIVGDSEYGYKNQKFKLNGQLLHAKKLSFIHPTLNREMTFECDLPNYFKDVLKKIKKGK